MSSRPNSPALLVTSTAATLPPCDAAPFSFRMRSNSRVVSPLVRSSAGYGFSSPVTSALPGSVANARVAESTSFTLPIVTSSEPRAPFAIVVPSLNVAFTRPEIVNVPSGVPAGTVTDVSPRFSVQVAVVRPSSVRSVQMSAEAKSLGAALATA